jgi:hypothetical protein
MMPSLLNNAVVQKSNVFILIFSEAISLSFTGANSVTDSDLKLRFPTAHQCHYKYMPFNTFC